jgi:hypothetical protein
MRVLWEGSFLSSASQNIERMKYWTRLTADWEVIWNLIQKKVEKDIKFKL